MDSKHRERGLWTTFHKEFKKNINTSIVRIKYKH